jgi:ribosomal protein S18 acetylase RimI-like enzyme
VTATANNVVIRRELRPGDDDAIVELHDRIYRAEYGVDGRMADRIREGIGDATARGWPHDKALGDVWLVDLDGRLAGSLALVLESPAVGRVHWFVLDPALRGRGLGRRLVGELVVEARAKELKKLRLETFSALTAAAAIYKKIGFNVISEREVDWWGPTIVYQHYELALR